MYNGIEAAAVKGTGLSGYVQRSRATVQGGHAPTMRTTEEDEGMIGGRSINPLEQRRSQRENEEMTNRLAAHNALRAVRLRVLHYGEERRAAGVAAETVDRECKELYTSLIEAARRDLKKQQRAEEKKGAEKFAAAVGLKPSSGGLGSGFDRATQEEAKQKNEEARRKAQEEKLVENLKRVRQEVDKKEVGE